MVDSAAASAESRRRADAEAAAAAARAAAPVVSAGPATAREACGGRVFLAMAACLDTECENPRYRSQGECVQVLEIKARRRQAQ